MYATAIIDRLNPLAREKKLGPIMLEDSVPPYVVGDPTRMTRVLTNLISNAIRYTDQGEVCIIISHGLIDDAHILCRCEVVDTGIGIPADKHVSIFNKFVQADTSTTRRYGGTGLGLAITKQLVELMGGEIGLASEVGQGSTFWFEIPFTVTTQLHHQKSGHRATAIYSALNPEETKVLVAEDHPLNQLYICKLLRRLGINTFKVVGTGIEVIENYQSGDWDMILMDCHMPVKNGYDTTLEIRELEKTTGHHVPIIAMTANAMVGDREKCMRCGMDDYVSKPIEIEDIANLMGQWIDFGDQETRSVLARTHASSCINLTQWRSYFEGDENVERELMHTFIHQSDINLETMTTNRAESSHGAWSEAAHMLKGAASTLGAKKLTLLCSTAQTMDAAAETERTALLAQIKEAYDQVKLTLVKEGLLSLTLIFLGSGLI